MIDLRREMENILFGQTGGKNNDDDDDHKHLQEELSLFLPWRDARAKPHNNSENKSYKTSPIGLGMSKQLVYWLLAFIQ